MTVSSAMGAAPLAVKLRTATAGVHQRLEASLDLLGEDLSLPDYVRLLRALHAFLAPWEARLAAGGCVAAAELEARRHATRLLDDLRHFQAAPDRAAVPELPPLASPAAVLGSRYVIEGSTLGGQLIAPHLERRFGLTPARGCAYFSGYGEGTGLMWHRFRAQLAEAPPAWHGEAVAAAVATFEALAGWLAPWAAARRASAAGADAPARPLRRERGLVPEGTAQRARPPR